MTDYRLYFLDGQGRITRAVDVDCGGDAQALEKAEGLTKGQPGELWQRARLVGKVGVVRTPE